MDILESKKYVNKTNLTILSLIFMTWFKYSIIFQATNSRKNNIVASITFTFFCFVLFRFLAWKFFLN